MSKELNRAIMHAVNYHSLDARLNMPDWKIADLITGEVFKHLCGASDVQIIERMTPEERAKIGQPSALEEAARKAADALDILMPGIGRVTSSAEQIKTVNDAYLAIERALRQSARQPS